MVAAQKAESKNEEIWDKVRARSPVVTDSGEGTTELGLQIAKLIAALTKAGQGSNPASAPSRPRERGHGRGCADRGTPGHPSSHNGQTGFGQTASDHSTPTCHGMGVTISRNQGQSSHGTNARHEGTIHGWTPNLSSVLDARAGAIWHGNAPLQPQLKPVWGRELRECCPTPCWWQPKQPAEVPLHSLPGPSPRPSQYESSLKDGTAGGCLSPFP